jgi:hypothetical protein
MEDEFDDEIRAPKKKKQTFVRQPEPYTVILNNRMTVTVVNQDVTKMEADAIVNPTDT